MGDRKREGGRERKQNEKWRERREIRNGERKEGEGEKVGTESRKERERQRENMGTQRVREREKWGQKEMGEKDAADPNFRKKKHFSWYQ